MKLIREVEKMRTHARIIRKEKKLIGFIPTMGYLHEGHLGIIKAVRKQVDVVIVSIFVNPIQFGKNEDFNEYPRDIKRDEELTKACGVDILFCPDAGSMYPEGYSTYVNVEGITDALCGKSRPGHFRGVTTVVAKLFEIVKPDIAYFGQKDAQQAFVIKKMVRDLNMDVTVKIFPTVREADGLAMSSRNKYLSASERRDAVSLYASLKMALELLRSGEKSAPRLIRAMTDHIRSAPSARIDYISIVDPESMKDIKRITGKALIALAVFVGKTRLIDNIIVDTDELRERISHEEFLTK